MTAQAAVDFFGRRFVQPRLAGAVQQPEHGQVVEERHCNRANELVIVCECRVCVWSSNKKLVPIFCSTPSTKIGGLCHTLAIDGSDKAMA